MPDREIIDAKRNEMVQTIISYIEQNPTNWHSGWIALGTPQNGKTNSIYRGLNALYLGLVGKVKGYSDNRWVTFNQAKELGASVKKGEKSSLILYYALYDKNTKKEYNQKTTADMSDEERKAYEKEFVKPVVRYSQVFNAQQCVNFPEKAAAPELSDEERQLHSNEIIERIIANSDAPIKYDGGDRAYYSILTDDIHLPEIKQFESMQDYYATALHEIAHSTGHASRLNRTFGESKFSDEYAVEELRAEMAAVFMQMENGIELQGKHIENHSAYLASWLSRVKDDPKVFTSAVSDAMKISDYVAEHYVKAASDVQVMQEGTKEKSMLATRYAILDAAMKVARYDMNSVDARYTDGFVDAYSSEYHALEGQVKNSGVSPSVDSKLVQAAIAEFVKPLIVPQYGWEQSDVEKALVERINDVALKEQATKLVYNSEALFDNTPISESNPLLTVEAKQMGYYTGTTSSRQQHEGFTILHDRQSDKWYLWRSDFIEGQTIDLTGTRERPTIGQSAKKSEILRTFNDSETYLTAFDSKEQAQEYWERESAKIKSLREQDSELNEGIVSRQAEIDNLMIEKSLLMSAGQEKATDSASQAMNEEIRAYYIAAFPNDEVGKDIPNGVTFKDFYAALSNGESHLDEYYANDSVVRERLFRHLEQITSQKYTDIYNLWLSAEAKEQTVGNDVTKENEQTSTDAEPIVLNPDSRFAEQVDAVLSGADTESTHLKVMDTPFLLRQVGAPSLPILMTAKHLKTTTQSSGSDSANYHGLDVDIIKRLPELLSDPVMIMDSLTRNDSIVVVTETVDRENRPVIGAVMFDGKGYIDGIRLSANILTSTYGRNNFENFLNTVLNENKLLYWSKEKSQTLLNVPGIQFPDKIEQVDSDIIIRKSNAFVNVQKQNSSQKVDSAVESKPMDTVAATVSESTSVNRPTIKLRMTEAEAKIFAEFVAARNDSGMGAKQVIDMGVDRPQSRDFWIGLAYLGKVKQTDRDFGVEFDRTKEYVLFEYDNLAEQEGEVTSAEKTGNAQKKNPDEQTNPTEPSLKWQRVNIPADCIGKEYGWRTMITIPKTSGYVGFAMFVPTKLLQRQNDGTYVLQYDSTKKDFLKATNDGREVVFDGDTLEKAMRGEKVPYQAKRVRAGKEAQQMIEQTLANVPSEMQAMERWCVHQKYNEKNAEGKTQVKKRIFDVNRIDEEKDNFAKCNDSTTWASIERATSVIRTSKKSLTGLTFVVGDGISVIDLDHCFDSAGKPSALATDLMAAFEGTYMEKSMSGTGLHIFVKGDLRNSGKFGNVNKGSFGDIEVYDENKFMSVTGNIIGDVRTLGTVTAAQQAAVQKYLKSNEVAKKNNATQKRSVYSTGHISDDDVIAKIRASKRGAEFDSLFAGHKEGADWSREDYALINTIAFFTPNQDRNQIQRIFEHSGLYRPQKGEKYLNRTIDAVLSRLKNPTNIWNNQSTATSAKPKGNSAK
ncbi:MAG: zincin-like metallopeptidase domain-containing protein [Corallococcus sp.]|nr:zincin-like metallopeptidase domain-containing protein [Corallococcus sp.]MCM1395727.1 zincin-like metallopeptidase domain-containing protein [Corallococcus sp.]